MEIWGKKPTEVKKKSFETVSKSEWLKWNWFLRQTGTHLPVPDKRAIVAEHYS